MLADLRSSLPVDIVLLNLHGSMIAEGYDDCEGDLLRHVRSICGGDTVIGRGSIIGGNVWVVESVGPETMVLESPPTLDFVRRRSAAKPANAQD